MNYKILTCAFLIIALSACTNKNTDNTDVEEVATEAATDSMAKIVYVEVDSLMTQYQFAKDFSVILTRKGENIQNTLAARERALQQQATAMQKKYESGGFSSAEELQAAQQDLALQQQNLQALGERLTSEFAQEQAEFNEALRDSIQSFLRVYNKEKKYDYILSRAGDNLLFANPHLDITSQVIAGLNKRYVPSKEVQEKLKEK